MEQNTYKLKIEKYQRATAVMTLLATVKYSSFGNGNSNRSGNNETLH